MGGTPASGHTERVQRVADQLRARKGTAPLALRKKAVSHQVPKRNDRWRTDEKIDLSDLSEILAIDVNARTCTAEPGVTFVDLVAATLRHGLVPLVVPELKTITIGGAVSGCSIESSSFRYGGFHDTCLEYEVITANGEVLCCAPDNEHQLVFQMMHGSFGTLGILSRLKFALGPARPFVHVTYEKHATLDTFRGAIARHRGDPSIDFLDGIIHSPAEWVLSIGRYVAAAPYTNRYDWMKVYFRSTAQRAEDYLTTPDYFFRYDRGVTHVFPSSFLGRLLFGRLSSSGNLLRLAEKFPWLIPERGPPITVDLFIPFSRFADFMEWYEPAIGHFPLWCVPYRRVRDYEWLSPAFYAPLQDDLFIDLAIYGMRQPEGRNIYREIEDALPRVNGIKTLISYNYYDEETFWRWWNRPNYVAVKRLTDPRNLFRDLYEKTCRAARGLDADSPRSGA